MPAANVIACVPLNWPRDTREEPTRAPKAKTPLPADGVCPGASGVQYPEQVDLALCLPVDVFFETLGDVFRRTPDVTLFGIVRPQ